METVLFLLLVVIVCGLGIPVTLLIEEIQYRVKTGKQPHGTPKNFGALLAVAAVVNIPITLGWIALLAVYGQANLAVAWTMIYIIAWIVALSQVWAGGI
jgi:hypothetical protein